MQRPEPDDPPVPERNPKREEPGEPLPIGEPGQGASHCRSASRANRRAGLSPDRKMAAAPKLSAPAPISIGEQ